MDAEAKPQMFVPQPASAQEPFALTPDEHEHLRRLLEWQEASTCSTYILGQPQPQES